jgi:fatty-acyl-CoA synthase
VASSARRIGVDARAIHSNPDRSRGCCVIAEWVSCPPSIAASTSLIPVSWRPSARRESASFDPSTALQAIEEFRCDVLYGLPTMFIAILNHPEFEKYDLSSLRRRIMAGAPCPIEVMKEVASRMNMSEITIAYGMTETSPVSFQSSRDDPLELRVSTVGRIQPRLEVKIVDSRGKVVPRSEAGELCTRGYLVMLGY